MNPYTYVKQSTEQGESLLSLCAGIGMELAESNSKDITAVDIAPQYLEKLNQTHPNVQTVCSDVYDYLFTEPTNSVDIISIIDGIEHMPKAQGLKVIRQMKRVARKQILLFTPQGHGDDGYLRNEPHDAWGISGADEHQTHKSGWTLEELQDLGFELIQSAEDTSQHGEPYTALMMKWDK
jgi:ubiquinone/menaquinone biosynthesis C-methylase UbiE